MFQFEIYGKAPVQKAPQFTCPCGKGHCWDPSKKDKEQIRWQVKPFAPAVPLACPVELTLVFFRAVPKGVSKAVREQMLNRVILPDTRPDDDNLAYLVTNALKELVYDDDKRICARHVYKFYGPEAKTIIRVRPILQAQPLGYRDVDDIE